jgi:hypothetical protein
MQFLSLLLIPLNSTAICKKYGTGNKSRENGVYAQWKDATLQQDLAIGNYIFKRVDNFNYLGTLVNKMNNRSVEVNA